MHKEELLELLKNIRCKARLKSGTEVATECINLVEEKFTSANSAMLEIVGDLRAVSEKARLLSNKVVAIAQRSQQLQQ